MPSTTHADFGHDTEALEVAKAFTENIRGKTVIVTGVNKNGIGFSTVQAFASQSPAHLILAGRSLPKVQECVDALKKEFPDLDYRILKVDLSNQAAVRAAAAEVLSWTDVPTIDIMINNAAVMGLEERTLTPDGLEMHFGTNHIGHWLFTCLVMPKVIAAAKQNPQGSTRIVNVTSLSPTVAGIRWSDVNFEKKNRELPEDERPSEQMMRMWGYEGDLGEHSYIAVEGYNQSKVANVLSAVGINTRLYGKYGIVALACHPGIIKTELGRNFAEDQLNAIDNMVNNNMFKYKTLGAGSSTSLTAALDPKLGEDVGVAKNGSVYGVMMKDCQILEVPARSGSPELAERLWKLSEELVKEKFEW